MNSLNSSNYNFNISHDSEEHLYSFSSNTESEQIFPSPNSSPISPYQTHIDLRGERHWQTELSEIDHSIQNLNIFNQNNKLKRSLTPESLEQNLNNNSFNDMDFNLNLTISSDDMYLNEFEKAWNEYTPDMESQSEDLPRCLKKQKTTEMLFETHEKH